MLTTTTLDEILMRAGAPTFIHFDEACANAGLATPCPTSRSWSVLYCFHQNNDDSKCEVAHTSPPIFPIKSGRLGARKGEHHGTKTSYRRDYSCNGDDHLNGRDVGHAEHVTDLPSSTFAFVLRQSDQLLPPTARQAGGRCCVTRSPLASTSKCLAQMKKSPGRGQSD